MKMKFVLTANRNWTRQPRLEIPSPQDFQWIMNPRSKGELYYFVFQQREPDEDTMHTT